MKVINNIIAKFGEDKVMHFMGGGWITSLFSPFGWIGILIGVILTLVLSIIKEKFLDEFFDKKDIYAAMIGSGISVIITVIFYILF